MAFTQNGPGLHPMTEELAGGRNFAAVTTVLPSGRLQSQMLWVGLKDGRLVINTETHRRRYQNLQRDPRITVLIRDEDDPYRYAEVRGRVEQTTTGDEARKHVDEVARKYTGQDYPPDGIKSCPRSTARPTGRSTTSSLPGASTVTRRRTSRAWPTGRSTASAI